MRHFSLGFDKDQVAIVELSGSLYQLHREAYTNRLKEFAGIEDVAFAMEKVAAQDSYNTNGAQYKGKDFQYFMILCSYNFLNVMGILKIVAICFIVAVPVAMIIRLKVYVPNSF